MLTGGMLSKKPSPSHSSMVSFTGDVGSPFPIGVPIGVASRAG